MLHITQASDVIEVKNLTVCIYAVPGVGKTTLGFTADRPLLLDFDKGCYRAGNRGAAVIVERWEDVEAISAKDLEPYRTLVVDTAGRALDALTAAIIARNPKMGNGGALTLQGFGELKARFTAWTKLVRSFGLDVVLVAHSDEQRKGDEVIERLDMQGGSKNEVYKSADAMGRLYLVGGKRTLNFSPTDTAFGKNPAQLEPLPVPRFADSPQFLGEVIEQIKAALNAHSAKQTEVNGKLTDWQTAIEDATDGDDLNALLPQTAQAGEDVRENVKRLLRARAKKLGFAYDIPSQSFQTMERVTKRAQA
jgi:hypothetical protein